MNADELRRRVNAGITQHLQNYDNEHDVQNEIHPALEFDYNSINLLIGRRGSGKTFNVFKQVVILGQVPNDYHMMIYITKNANDGTYLKFKDLITLPVMIVSYEDSLNTLKELRHHKQIYDEIRAGNIEDEQTIQETYEFLHVQNCEKKRIHTIVLYDDALNVFDRGNRKSEEYRMIFDNRHTKITYFFCLQDPASISTDIRGSLDRCWLFGGFGALKYQTLMRTIPVPFDYQKVFSDYKQIASCNALLIDFFRGRAYFIDYNGDKQEIDNDGNIITPGFDEKEMYYTPHKFYGDSFYQ